MKSVLVCTILLCTTVYSLHLPSYVKPCARKDPDFNKCAHAHAKEVFPHVMKGDRKYKVPVLDPLQIQEVKVVDEGPRQAGLTLIMKQAKVYGLKDSELTETNFDFDKKFVQHAMLIPRAQIIGKYEISGKILLLPISGNGDLNITLDNVNVTYTHDYTLEPLEDKELHMILKNDRTYVTPSKMYLTATNLFGDNRLSRQMNEFLNENWQDVYKELSPAVVSVFSEIITTIITGIATTVPFDEAFPETLPN